MRRGFLEGVVRPNLSMGTPLDPPPQPRPFETPVVPAPAIGGVPWEMPNPLKPPNIAPNNPWAQPVHTVGQPGGVPPPIRLAPEGALGPPQARPWQPSSLGCPRRRCGRAGRCRYGRRPRCRILVRPGLTIGQARMWPTSGIHASCGPRCFFVHIRPAYVCCEACGGRGSGQEFRVGAAGLAECFRVVHAAVVDHHPPQCNRDCHECRRRLASPGRLVGSDHLHRRALGPPGLLQWAAGQF